MHMLYPFLDLATINARYADDLHRAAARVIDSGRYIGGSETEEFNRMLAGLCRAPHAIGVSNGLDALRLIIEGYKVTGRLSPGDEIIIPANTYIASVLAVTHAGLNPVLVDPDEMSMNLSATGALEAITEKTRAIMPVHLYGQVAWSEELADLARNHGLIVIEDAAQAIGATSPTDGLFGSRKAGALGHAGAFSFYPTKNIGALGDAGAVVTHDTELFKAVAALANYGGDRRYHNIYAGFNCRMDPIQAAMLCAKLPDADASSARRFERAVAYNNVISHPGVIKPAISPTVTDQIWHQYVIRVPAARDRFIEYLTSEGVGTDIHYATPPHMQPCYRTLPHRPLPITERLASEIVSLPISDCTSVADAAAIGRIINKFPIHR